MTQRHGADRLASRWRRWVAPRDARAARLRQRGRQADRRRPQRPPAVHRRRAPSLSATGPYTWTPDKLFGFFYPANNGGDDDLPGTAFQRSRDDVQRHVAELPRRRRPPVRRGVGTATTPRTRRSPAPGRRRRPAACSTAWRRSRSTRRAGNDPNQDADGTPLPLAKTPLRLRNWAASRTNEPLRQETIAGRLRHDPGAARPRGGAIISTRDAVTFGFGLEQVDASRRATSCVKRAWTTCCRPRPTPRRRRSSASSTRPTTSRRRRPTRSRSSVTAFDERGDMKQVNLYANGALVGTTVPVYPFQFRYTPPASAVGQTVTLTAEAIDKAGNKSHAATCYVNVVDARRRRSQSPVPVDTADDHRHAGRRLDADLHQRRLPQQRRRRRTRTRGCATASSSPAPRRRRTRSVSGRHRPRRSRAAIVGDQRRAGTRRRDLRGAGHRQPGAGPAARGPGGPPARRRPARRRHGSAGRRHRPAPRAPPVRRRRCKLAQGRTASPVTCDLSADGADDAKITRPPIRRAAGRQDARPSSRKSGKGKVTMTLRSTKAPQEGAEGGPQDPQRQDHQDSHGQGQLDALARRAPPRRRGPLCVLRSLARLKCRTPSSVGKTVVRRRRRRALRRDRQRLLLRLGEQLVELLEAALVELERRAGEHDLRDPRACRRRPPARGR